MSAALTEVLRPDWPAPAGVTALMSTRSGGVSLPPFDSLDLRPAQLSDSPTEQAEAVAENQRRFAAALGAIPVWLHQVHGTDVVRLTAADLQRGAALPRADASISTEAGVACAVLVADCLPVLLASSDGRVVGAAHAGWRGLAAGVLERTVSAMVDAAGVRPDELQAWLGPCIGPEAFEVDAVVLSAFGADPLTADQRRFAYRPRADGSPRWRADLAGLASDRLVALGLQRISGGSWCTVADSSRFFSFRREGRCGRLAAAISRVGRAGFGWAGG